MQNMTLIEFILAKPRYVWWRVNDIIIKVFIKLFKNWIEIILFALRFKTSVNLKFRNGSVKVCKNFTEFMIEVRKKILKEGGIDIQIMKNLIKFRKNGRKITFFYDSEKRLMQNLYSIQEQFLSEEYKWLNVKGKDVIDIGANIGDSAIYFALKGARHIYAFEPYPYSYNLAKKNIKLNNLQKKVTLFNEAIGAREGFITIDKNYKNVGGDDLKKFKKGKRIKITTLDEIVKRLKPKHPILKMDCEGAEYDAILNSSISTLTKFSQIIIEYHYGYINLKKKLEEAGFTCRYTPPTFSFNKFVQRPKMYFGLIFATNEGYKNETI